MREQQGEAAMQRCDDRCVGAAARLGRRALLLWCVVAAVMVGCASRPRVTPGVAPPRLDVIPGSTLVVPLTLDQVDPWHSVVARIDGGSRLEAKLYQVVVRVPPSGEGSDEGWLPAEGVWSAKPPNSRDRSNAPTGTWVALVNIPAEANGSLMALGKRVYALNWLPIPSLLPAPEGHETEPLLDPWRPVLSEAQIEDQELMSRVRPEGRSPLTRWRFKLLVNGLKSGAQSPDAPEFKDPVIEAIARQNEERWRVALLWLWSSKPELASRLKARLCAIVNFGDGTLAPAWSVDHTGLDRLLSDLLNSDATPERRAELAEAWMTDQPGGAAWVIDDGGLVDDQRRSIIPTIGVANLQDRSTLAWASARGAAGTPEPNPLASMQVLKLLVPPPATKNSATTPIIAHVGRWVTEVAAVNERLAVRPPGFTIGPLVRDQSMQEWTLGGAASPARAEWATAAMLHRPAPDPGAPPSGAESKRWELLVECKISPAVSDVAALGRECVRVSFGPSARPTAVLRVDMTGKVTDEAPRDPMAPAEFDTSPAPVEINRSVDRWSFRLQLPPGAIEADGLLRVSITRVDALGRRSAWPRPMLPWQQEPSRAALDTRAWDSGQ